MNKLKNLSTLVLALFISMASMTAEAKNDKTVEKARIAVENASPDDWKTYAKSAKMLIRKKSSMTEAKQWIEKSISIRETALNLEIFGDYYVVNNVPKKASEYYIKSMKKMRAENPGCDLSEIQAKVVAMSKMK